MNEIELAKLFHKTYEHLAPEFGYKTRPETQEFSESSSNGQLMIAVCKVILVNIQAALAEKEKEIEGLREKVRKFFDLKYRSLNGNEIQKAEADLRAAVEKSSADKPSLVESIKKKQVMVGEQAVLDNLKKLGL